MWVGVTKNWVGVTKNWVGVTKNWVGVSKSTKKYINNKLINKLV